MSLLNSNVGWLAQFLFYMGSWIFFAYTYILDGIFIFLAVWSVMSLIFRLMALAGLPD